jgi:putative tryptophan/tyrosine transport system substrate-binding protein
MASHIGRRKFLATLGGAATAWPLAARAQQPAMPVVGFLFSQSADPFAHRVRAFRQGLKETGYVEGENIVIEYRWSEGQFGRLPILAEELVRRQVAVIVAPSLAATLAVKAATTTIPIVFAVAEDPVRFGLVASLARPGGNLTGINFFSSELVPKRLELLRELLPKAARVALLVDPSNVGQGERTEKEVQAAARILGLQIQTLNATSSREIDAAFAALVRERADALFVSPSGLFNGRRVQLANMAARHAVPMTSATREIAEAGGLMSYGPNIADAWRVVGVYAGRILKGATPRELPVEQPSKFEFIINAQTARMLGLEIPPTLLARADEVIE